MEMAILTTSIVFSGTLFFIIAWKHDTNEKQKISIQK